MSIKVFLADGHAIVRDGLRCILQAQGDIIVVGEAADGWEVVRQVSELNPDVVVIEIAMPRLNGIDATKEIRERNPSIQVVILSIYSTPDHIFRAFQAGAKGYILKESAGQEVVNAIRAVHAGGRYLSKQIAETVIDDYVRQRRASKDRSPLERLSSREREILQLVVEGKTSAEIAEILYISPKTVETYRSHLMHKLGIRNIPCLVKFAIQQGLISLN
jgi:DNA-binding NarL/FixJ family response regulator